MITYLSISNIQIYNDNDNGKHIFYMRYNMGNYSYFIKSNDAAKQLKIRWDKVPEETVSYFESDYSFGYDWETSSNVPVPATLHEVAEKIHDKKFWGYLESSTLKAISELSKHGFDEVSMKEERPRFYMEYEGFDEINVLELIPGSDKFYRGHIRFDLPYEEDESWDEETTNKMYEKWTADREVYMKHLVETMELLRQNIQNAKFDEKIDKSDKIGGWIFSCSDKMKRDTAAVESIIKLPKDYPLQIALVRQMLKECGF